MACASLPSGACAPAPLQVCKEEKTAHVILSTSDMDMKDWLEEGVRKLGPRGKLSGARERRRHTAPHCSSSSTSHPPEGMAGGSECCEV